jgi:hypothetical protein
MKQRVRTTNGVMWLAKAIPSDIAEMDAKYNRIGDLKWNMEGSQPEPVEPEPVEPEPVEPEPVEPEPDLFEYATAAELMAEEE